MGCVALFLNLAVSGLLSLLCRGHMVDKHNSIKATIVVQHTA